MLGGQPLEQVGPDVRVTPRCRGPEPARRSRPPGCAPRCVRPRCRPSVAYRRTRPGRPAPRAWCTRTAASSEAPASSASSIRRCRAASAARRQRARRWPCRHRSWRKATPRWLRRISPAWCGARSGRDADAELREQPVGDRLRRAHQQVEQVARGVLEVRPSWPGWRRARCGGRSSPSWSSIWVTKNGLPPVSACRRSAIDGPVVDQRADGRRCSAAAGRERRRVRRTGCVAEQRAQRVRRRRSRRARTVPTTIDSVVSMRRSRKRSRSTVPWSAQCRSSTTRTRGSGAQVVDGRPSRSRAA